MHGSKAMKSTMKGSKMMMSSASKGAKKVGASKLKRKKK